MNVAEKVAALEALLVQVQRNAAKPRPRRGPRPTRVAPLEHAVVRPAGVMREESAVAKTLASEPFDVGETTAPMEAVTAAALMALEAPAAAARKSPIMEDTLPQPQAAAAPVAAAKPTPAKPVEAAPVVKPAAALPKTPAAAAASKPATPAARQSAPAGGGWDPVKPAEPAAATQRGVAPASTSRTPAFVRKNFVEELRRTTPGVGTGDTASPEALPLPIVTSDTPVRAPAPAREPPRAALEAKAPAAAVQKQPAKPIIPAPAPVKPAAAAAPAPAAVMAPAATTAAEDRISDVPTLMRKSSPELGAAAERAHERAVHEAAAVPDVGAPAVERVYNDRISDAPTVLRKAVTAEIEEAELQAAAKQAEPALAAPVPQVELAPPPVATAAEPEASKPLEEPERIEVKAPAAVEAPEPVKPVEAPEVAAPPAAKPAPAVERVQPAPVRPAAPIEEARRPRKGAPRWLIGLAAAVLLAGIVFNGLRTGWLNDLLGTTPAPTATGEAPVPPPSGALVLPTQPSQAVPGPSETVRPTATTTPPPVPASASAAATQTPPAKSATAAAPSAAAPAGTASTVDTSPKPPGDPAKLPPNRGYLLIKTSAPGNVFITGRLMGATGQPLEMTCGVKFVRIAEPGSADPPKWVTDGQSVQVACQALTTVSF